MTIGCLSLYEISAMTDATTIMIAKSWITSVAAISPTTMVYP
jgi:hypothetical protein